MTLTAEGVLVFSENQELAFQLLGKGRNLADKLGAKLCVLLVGEGLEDLGTYIEHGADKVYVADEQGLSEFAVELYSSILLKTVKVSSPEIILVGATKRGKELAPRVAAALDTGCMTECINLDLDNKRRLVSERLCYGGSSVATEVSRKKPHIATVPPRIFNKLEPKTRTGEVIKISTDLPSPRVMIIERKEKPGGDLRLEEAPIIVSAGRGFKNKEDLQLLEELANVLDASIGCTRPVAADSGWLDEWIGISGKKVTPRLYVACGVSGTVQHAAGIRDAKIIVSINMDDSANIFQLSDYGVVADLYLVLPALTKAIKRRLG